jgi:predicted HTH transcriptional regulator
MGEPERIFNTLNSISDLQTFIDNEPESLYVDFKEVANPTNPMKQNDDKENFAKALSGFANSNGGVLIWGVREEKNSLKLSMTVQANGWILL